MHTGTLSKVYEITPLLDDNRVSGTTGFVHFAAVLSGCFD